jgi:hypothetical protein
MLALSPHQSRDRTRALARDGAPSGCAASRHRSRENDAPESDRAFSSLVAAPNGAMENSIEERASNPNRTLQQALAAEPRYHCDEESSPNQSRDREGAVAPFSDHRSLTVAAPIGARFFIAFGGPQAHRIRARQQMVAAEHATAPSRSRLDSSSPLVGRGSMGFARVSKWLPPNTRPLSHGRGLDSQTLELTHA